MQARVVAAASRLPISVKQAECLFLDYHLLASATEVLDLETDYHGLWCQLHMQLQHVQVKAYGAISAKQQPCW